MKHHLHLDGARATRRLAVVLACLSILAACGVPPSAASLEAAGPWVLFSTESGLWAMNADGTGLTRLTKEPIVAPSDLSAGLSPSGAQFAFVTASDPLTLQELTLNLISLPEGKVRTITPLTSPATEPRADAEICDPAYEAARAVTIADGLRWSPDGSRLAFVGAMQASSADVYVYDTKDESISRVSDEPGQAYDLQWHWLPGSQTIVYFSASCFGTGAGFSMEGAWKTDARTAKTELIYQPNPESWGEEFVTWARSGQEAFFVATLSGCPYRDLRMVDAKTKTTTSILDGCFDDLAVGPTSALALLAGSDFTDRPGLYLYPEADIPGLAPEYIPMPNGRRVRTISSHIFVSVVTEKGVEIRSLKWDGSPGRYAGRGDFPALAHDGETWAWNESGAFHLSGSALDAPVSLLEGTAYFPFWYEDAGQAGIVQHLIFFDEAGSLYMLSLPDRRPVLLAEHLRLLAEPVEVWP